MQHSYNDALNVYIDEVVINGARGKAPSGLLNDKEGTESKATLRYGFPAGLWYSWGPLSGF
ncbi:hypothetical protein ColLi_00472 [Colletotrichum liriopes]|uniref:Uncharacterized protein n=1 Tax=Colletotrichum liriopes TaxID=708192 RepID=A0AA37LM05_9PEZI|nr:hypothetical protein ColLi_00472 [Colletotrichum liriopes]